MAKFTRQELDSLIKNNKVPENYVEIELSTGTVVWVNPSYQDLINEYRSGVRDSDTSYPLGVFLRAIPYNPIYPSPTPSPGPIVNPPKPETNPPNTIPTSKVEDMLDISPALDSNIYTYNVGKQSSFIPKTYKLTNKTKNSRLLISITVPAFLKISTENIFTLDINSSVNLTISFNENEAKGRSIAVQKIFVENLELSVSALSTAQVYT